MPDPVLQHRVAQLERQQAEDGEFRHDMRSRLGTIESQLAVLIDRGRTSRRIITTIIATATALIAAGIALIKST